MAFENFFYIIYLVVVLLSALLIAAVAKIKINWKLFILAIVPVFIIFVAWDIFAVWRGHWSFGMDKMLGPVIINQPLEELAFFIVIPLFHIIVWEAIKKFRRW
jgi:lycopene cyclase domain-containing protein